MAAILRLPVTVTVPFTREHVNELDSSSIPDQNEAAHCFGLQGERPSTSPR